MHFDHPPQDDQRRLPVREWVATNPEPSGAGPA